MHASKIHTATPESRFSSLEMRLCQHGFRRVVTGITEDGCSVSPIMRRASTQYDVRRATCDVRSAKCEVRSALKVQQAIEPLTSNGASTQDASEFHTMTMKSLLSNLEMRFCQWGFQDVVT